MEREELYKKTVDVLLDAYNSEELMHSNCEFCAVGNICKEASQITKIGNGMWGNLFYTDSYGKQVQPEFCIEDTEQIKRWREEAKILIEATGYSQLELMKIEHVFESSIQNTLEGHAHWCQKHTKKQGQFIGLCAVLDVLREFHQVDCENHETSVTRLTTIKDKFLTVA
jgi:hypothetical protein